MDRLDALERENLALKSENAELKRQLADWSCPNVLRPLGDFSHDYYTGSGKSTHSYYTGSGNCTHSNYTGSGNCTHSNYTSSGNSTHSYYTGSCVEAFPRKRYHERCHEHIIRCLDAGIDPAIGFPASADWELEKVE